MTTRMWFKVDDKLHSHPKWVGLNKGAKALWTTAGSWSADQLTDGFVPKSVLSRLGGTTAEAQRLVNAELWRVVENGWQFHDWQDRNPSRESVQDKRSRDAERLRQWREKKRSNDQ